MKDLPQPGVMREHFLTAVAAQMRQAKANDSYLILLRFDIDGFRKLNEQSGYLDADRVLKILFSRIKSQLLDNDLACWLGADEFALLLGINSKDEIASRVSGAYALLREPCDISTVGFQPRLSLGVALYPDDSLDGDGLVLAAESAQQHAKTRGGAQINYYSRKIHKQALHLSRLEKDLQGALTRKEFYLLYQPKVDSTTGIVKGFEALLRWQHPERGVISPLEFIPILEENRMILDVGEWIFSEVCLALGRWKKAGVDVVPISVNVSMHQFKQAGFVERLVDILKLHDIETKLIDIEITESCLMDDGQENIAILNQLKSMGMSISIDDFGTGYSSLSYLKRFPVDTLKIDRSFITNVHNRRESDNAGIVTAIMALSHSLHLEVVAEGVESAHELAFLYALGCRTIQGFLFSKPLKEDAVLELLETSFSMAETLVKVRQQLQARELIP
ncbi:diguanylate cyclase/phosphodiesterase (GGDEF & EAL domains) with PAS/PAC sensor(s) [hydrothermal vent metagenome]|uniref:Diguanylate cyclase/phosphodiesterase (GGDEF & EAL domains) with PAS/PAC sensor(S) n=1 Tax=hydrothermal vent metagenome TaxID=652676 RepID=A0A3B1BLM1_9ZZZZ